MASSYPTNVWSTSLWTGENVAASTTVRKSAPVKGARFITVMLWCDALSGTVTPTITFGIAGKTIASASIGTYLNWMFHSATSAFSTANMAGAGKASTVMFLPVQDAVSYIGGAMSADSIEIQLAVAAGASITGLRGTVVCTA